MSPDDRSDEYFSCDPSLIPTELLLNILVRRFSSSVFIGEVVMDNGRLSFSVGCTGSPTAQLGLLESFAERIRSNVASQLVSAVRDGE